MSADRLSIEEHPDITALRARYERVAETPTAHVVDGLSLMAGLFVAMSPWIVGFDGMTTLRTNDLIIGIAIACLALAFMAVYERTHGMTWVLPLLGVWVIISPWVVSGASATTRTVLSNVIAGAVVALLGLGGVAVSMLRRRF